VPGLSVSSVALWPCWCGREGERRHTFHTTDSGTHARTRETSQCFVVDVLCSGRDLGRRDVGDLMRIRIGSLDDVLEDFSTRTGYCNDSILVEVPSLTTSVGPEWKGRITSCLPEESAFVFHVAFVDVTNYCCCVTMATMELLRHHVNCDRYCVTKEIQAAVALS